MEEMTNHSYEKDDRVITDFTLEMNMNRQQIKREGYSALDLLSDVGGIQAILTTFFASILAMLNYNNFDAFMVYIKKIIQSKFLSCSEGFCFQ